MFKQCLAFITAASLGLGLSGCTSLMASATGPEPVGNAPGEHTLSMSLQDTGIENTAGINMYKADTQFRDANVNVISFYGSVLLAGQVQSEELKAKAEKIVNQIAEVKQIHNELIIAPASYYAERFSDGSITKRIGSAFLFEKGFPSSRTKVFTVAGTVYLMGKLTPTEADQAVTIIKAVSGVKKIVKLVDYLPAPGAAAPTTSAS
ncbi:MAG: BON domain-containing protein [Moraxellaceae bacterium]